jgi:hypothetical protein
MDPALAHPHDLGHRQQQNPELETQRPVVDVVVVKHDAVGDRGLAAQTVRLRPARDSALHALAVRVAGDLGGESRRELGSLWPRTDQTHLSPQHVEELW